MNPSVTLGKAAGIGIGINWSWGIIFAPITWTLASAVFPAAILGRWSRDAPLQYDVVVQDRSGRRRVHRYASDEPILLGQVLRLEGRYWLVASVRTDAAPATVVAKPARYAIRLRQPDGREELGAFRRYRPDAPRIGHVLATIADGQPVSWQIVEERLAHDADGEPYLDLVAERDYGELEELPRHELEHAVARRDEQATQAVAAALSRAELAGLAVELVALEPGQSPDWEAARRYLEGLVLDEIAEGLLERCGVDPDRDPRESWLPTVRERLLADLERLRADVEERHGEIEEWEYLDGRVLAAVGSFEDEASPDSGYGRLCRLVDAGALAAAGFHRAYKPALQAFE